MLWRKIFSVHNYWYRKHFCERVRNITDKEKGLFSLSGNIEIAQNALVFFHTPTLRPKIFNIKDNADRNKKNKHDKRRQVKQIYETNHFNTRFRVTV